MATPWVPLRCPRCAAAVAVPPPMTTAAGWVICPACGATFPVLAPRDPPPLFSWEAYPGLYPALPAPRRPAPAIGRVTAAALVATALLLLGIAGFLLWGGASSLAPGQFSLGGKVVLASGAPLAGATVNLRSEAGYNTTVTTSASGEFGFRGIPAGAAVLNVSAPGYRTVNIAVFLSASYRATGAGPGGQVSVAMSGGATYPADQIAESPFANLETYVANLWSATVLLAIGGFLAAAGALFAYRGRRPVVAASAGVGAMVAPIALVELGATTAFPLLDWAITAATALGVVAFLLSASAMICVGRPPDPF